ncbi:MAG: terminase family protein [Candidatus Bathyarchaeota archaeon]|nr:terminase family protein [Candidatus Bathyarchaeota archaeon]
MPNFLKRARAFRPKKLLEERRKLREQALAIEMERLSKVESLKTDPLEFFRQVLGVEPTDYQKELIALFQKNQFVAARWSRQSGKSFTTSALLLNYALVNPNVYICVVGPSWRQTKIVIRRIGDFARRLPPGSKIVVQKTKITCPNGSIIEAFPNSPETIRGPTFHCVYMDESNFIANADEIYDAVLPTLGTTNGKFIATSTPWNTDSLFWKMCNHKDFEDFARHHVTWERAKEPNGPLKLNILEKIRKQYRDDPARWRREYDAEWAEDEDVWLSQNLIAQCIGTVKSCGDDLQPFNPEAEYEGEFYAGLDPAQTRDYHVLSVTELVDQKLYLRHLKIFPHPTYDAYVLGYIKTLQDRWGGFRKIRVDITRDGPSFIADMENAGIENAEGVVFSSPRKSEMASLLKKRMQDNRFFYPLLTWEKPYKGDICNEFNVERFALRADGGLAFSHPQGTHDDVFWASALSVFATTEMTTNPELFVVPR